MNKNAINTIVRRYKPMSFAISLCLLLCAAFRASVVLLPHSGQTYSTFDMEPECRHKHGRPTDITLLYLIRAIFFASSFFISMLD